MKIILFVLIGVLLPFIAGLSAVTLAMGVLLLFFAMCQWIDDHWMNEHIRGVGAVLLSVLLVAISLLGIWHIGIVFLSDLWF